MAKRRFIQIDGELLEVEPDYQSAPRSAKDTGILWNDRPYQDMGDKRFGSRVQHREFMKRHNLSTADDFHGTWRSAEAKRIAFRQGVDPSRKGDVVEAVKKLQQGYKPKPLPKNIIPRS